MKKILTPITVVLSYFEGLKDFLRGKLTTIELNERVFLNGFMPIRFQRQITRKGRDIVVLQGVADQKFLEIESERMNDGTYLMGWDLFIKGPCEYAKIKLLNGTIISMD